MWQAGQIVSVVGCDGKTSLIEQQATACQHLRVLVSTTTHIYPPPYGQVILGDEAALRHTPAVGITVVGCLEHSTGKLTGLHPHTLVQLLPRYDVVFLECDGSKGLPLKGWRADEPVIPESTTHTVGVVSLRGVGVAATSEHVLRLPLFLALTGLQEGAIVTLEAVACMVVAGMFAHGIGQHRLYINKLVTDEDYQTATKLATLVREALPTLSVYGGSTHGHKWRELV